MPDCPMGSPASAAARILRRCIGTRASTSTIPTPPAIRPTSRGRSADSDAEVALLVRQRVPVSRLFMTFLETAAMNDRYREAEAVLIGDPGEPGPSSSARRAGPERGTVR